MNTVKVGDKVFWAQARGRPPISAVIKYIDLCSRPGVKYGVPVDSVPANLLNTCCVSMTNGSWAYGTQLTPMEKK